MQCGLDAKRQQADQDRSSAGTALVITNFIHPNVKLPSNWDSDLSYLIRDLGHIIRTFRNDAFGVF